MVRSSATGSVSTNGTRLEDGSSHMRDKAWGGGGCGGLEVVEVDRRGRGDDWGHCFNPFDDITGCVSVSFWDMIRDQMWTEELREISGSVFDTYFGGASALETSGMILRVCGDRYC
ncbi:hypothetical protein Tco_0967616 [Tanacetum coccineum]